MLRTRYLIRTKPKTSNCRGNSSTAFRIPSQMRAVTKVGMVKETPSSVTSMYSCTFNPCPYQMDSIFQVKKQMKKFPLAGAPSVHSNISNVPIPIIHPLPPARVILLRINRHISKRVAPTSVHRRKNIHRL